MAKYSNTVEYKLRTTLDASGVSKLQSELVKVKKELDRVGSVGIINEAKVEKAKKDIREIQNALSKAFNPNLGLLNIDKFLGGLSKGNNTIADWGKTFSLAGIQGEKAMNSLVGRLAKIDNGLVSVSKTTDKVFNTLGNTVRWGVIASGFQSVLNSAHEAVDYVKELDRSLNDIRIVSDYNAQDMREFSLYANEAAQALGQTTVAYTDASLIFAQQGFNLEDSNKLAEMVLKVANTTGQATEEVSEQVTSWMNGYQMSIDQVGVTLDKVTKVAAVGAADTEELMTAASKVASTAHMLGVTEDQLITQMSTIISVTREAPENVGNALKTIYARLGDLKMGETLEDGVDLGKLSATLEDVGVQVLDDTGAMRNMGDVLEELMKKWSSFDRGQQQALAVQLAGKYQYSRFSALMENQQMYESQLQESIDSAGFLERTQEIYMDSLTAKSKSLQAATEGLISNLFDPDSIKPFQQILIDTVDWLAKFVDAAGGGLPVITALGSTMGRVFSKQIGTGINSAINNMSLASQQSQNEKARQNLLNKGLSNSSLESGSGSKIIDMVAPVSKYTSTMSPDQVQQYNEALERTVQIENNRVQIKKNLLDLDEQMTIEMKNQLGYLDEEQFRDETGRIDNEKVSQILNELSLQSGKDTKLAEYSKDLTFDLDSVKQAQAALLDYTEGTYEYKYAVSEVSDIVNTFPSQIEVLTKAHGADNQQIQRLIHSYEYLEEALTEENIDIKKVQKGLKEYGSTLDFLNQNVQEEISLNQKANQIQKERLQQILALSDAEAQQAAIEAEWAQTQENLARQQNIQNVVNMTMAVGQLSSAWMSFANLGSIWAEEDVATGDKIVETLMNLSFTIPMIVSAIPALQTGFKSVQKLLNGNNIVTALGISLNKFLAQSIVVSAEAALIKAEADLKEKDENEKRIATSTKATRQEKLEAAEARKAAAAVRDKAKANYEEAKSEQAKLNEGGKAGLAGLGKRLGSALSSFGKSFGPQLGVMLAIGAATAFVDYMISETKEKFTRQSEEATQAAEGYQEKETLTNDFNALYENYKETGEGADELKDKAKELFKTLNVSDGEVLLAADNFKELSERINDAQDAAGREALTKIGAFLNGSGKSALEGGLFQNGQLLDGSGFADIASAWSYKDVNGKYDYKNISENRSDFYEARRNNDFSGAYAAAQKELKDWQEQIEEYNNKIAEATKAGRDTSELEKARDILYENYDSLNSVFNNEEWKEYITQLSNAASIETDMINDNLAENNNSGDAQAIIDAYQNSQYVSEYLNANFDTWSGQLEYMIANTTDKAGKLALTLEYGKAKAQEGLEALGEEDDYRLTDFLYNEANEDGFTIFSQLDSLTDEYGEKLFPTDEAKEDYLKTVLESAIQEIEDNPNLTDEQKAQIMSSVNWDGPYNEILDSLTQGAIDAQKNAPSTLDLFKDMEAADEDVDEDQFQQVGKYIAENAEELEGYSANLSDNADALADVAEEQLRYDAALQRSYDSIEDWEAALQSDNIAEKAKAVEELSNTYNDLLDVGQGLSVSSDFSSDVDNLELLKRAIDGDTEAYNELQKKAAEDIYMQFGLDSSQFEQQWANLQNEMLDINGQNFADLEIGAVLDDEGFIAALEEMVNAAGMTSEEAQAYLSSMGVDAEIETEQAEQTDQQVYYDVVPKFNMVEGPTPTFPAMMGDDLTRPLYSSPVRVPSVTYESVPVSIDAKKTMAGFSLKTSTADGQSSGGNLKIKSATKGGTGAAKFSRTSAARAPQKASSGGKGGSGSSKTPKTKDKKDPDIDRYERINTQLEYVGNEFEKINKEHDRVAGWNLADVMNEEIDLLNEEIVLYKEKLKIQKEEAAELQGDLASKYGATFDENGLLTNYAAIHQKLYDDYNDLIDKYNSLDADGQEAFEAELEASDKLLKEFEEDYARYDELVGSEIKETINTLKDLQDQIEDIRIEAFRTQIGALDNIKDLNNALIDFNAAFDMRDSDNPFKNAEIHAKQLGQFFDDATGQTNEFYDNLIKRSKERLNDPNMGADERKYLEDQIKMMEQAKVSLGNGSIEDYGSGYMDLALTNFNTMMDQIKQFEETGYASIFGENEAELYEVGKEVFEQFTSQVIEFREYIDDLKEDIMGMMEDMSDRIQERQDQYADITDELEHQKDILEMLHGDKAYDDILKIESAQQNNYKASMMEMRETQKMWESMLSNFEVGSEQWKYVNEQIKETQKSLNETATEYITSLRRTLETNINKMLDAWTNNALGNDLEWIEQEWELINRNADYYLDQTNAAYETQKLQNEYLKLLDGSNDLHIQEMITQQMKDQLGYLREKKNLSEYDVAYANAQLEILQKRIALEEAQRNKNQIKLRRDSQGNYSYVYTADQDDVADKEGDLLDAQNNAYNLSKEQMRQTQEDSLSALGDAKNLLNDIWNDANLTLEEKKKRTETVIGSLKEYLDATGEQLSESQKNIINDFIAMTEMMTDENADRLADVYEEIINGNNDAFDQIDTRWSTSLTNWLNNIDKFNVSSDKMFDELIQNEKDWLAATEEVGKLAGHTYNDLGNEIDKVTEKTDSLAASQASFIEQLKNDAGIVTDYQSTLDKYIAKLTDAENGMKAYAQQVKELQSALKAKEAENATLQSQVTQQNAIINSYQNGGSGGSGSGGSGVGLGEGQKVKLKSSYAVDAYSGYIPDPLYKPGATLYIQNVPGVGLMANGRYHLGTKPEFIHGQTDVGWVDPKDIEAYRTGGYTGSWSNDEGRLAMLHQKEIVLNASDTENILKAVQAVREMTMQMKAGALSSISSGITNNFTPGLTGETIQQEVHITAEFPNVESSNDIREALLSLNDQAMQYSSRKR